MTNDQRKIARALKEAYVAKPVPVKYYVDKKGLIVDTKV